jgi:tetratricopeptide (TPR) repeat protein
VRVASEPTFTRYIFPVPKEVSVVAARQDRGLTLTFDGPLKFDLADVDAALPGVVTAVKSKTQDASASVQFDFSAKVDVRSFRDENGYAVDIIAGSSSEGRGALVLQPHAASPPPSLPPVTKPPTAAPAAAAPAIPAAAAAPSAPAAPAAPAVPPAQAAAAPASVKGKAPPQSAKTAPSAHAPTPVKPAPPARTADKPAPIAASGGKIPVELTRDGQNLKLSFEFMAPTAAAVFNRADTLWIVFDSKADIDLSALRDEASRTIRGAELTRAPDADIVRIKLDRPHLTSVASDGPEWTVEIGDTVAEPVHALELQRNLIGPTRSSMTIAIDAPHELHRIGDPEAGDQLLVVTAFAPARGLVHTQNFIEFRALASEQGVVVEPLADNINMALGSDKVVISRPGGLTLSSSLQALLRHSILHPPMFDPQLWGFDREGSYAQRQSELIAAAAAEPEKDRLIPRLNLARFYLARSMYAEAKGVLDVALEQRRPGVENVTAIVLRGVTEIMMDRPRAALKDLADPSVGDLHDAPLWRALAYAREGKWGEARESFKRVETAIATLPVELQRFALKEEMRSAIEVRAFGEAENELYDLQTIGIPHSMQPAISVLLGRLDEGLGRTEDALAAYRAAAASWDRPTAAQAQLRETQLRYSLGDLKRSEVVSDLESLTTVWRGDETEIEALQMLARLYSEEGRYRDSFYVMRNAMMAHPDWDITAKIQEDAAKTFDALFLSGRGNSLSALDALSLFYDFRELTPIGSRGDEMIRRLADRLVAVDLLDQAAGLLQYQVDKRLQGAARAEVATRLAVIYLMDRKPDKALVTLRATRSSDLSTTLRDQRLLLEARALSDLGQHALALEVIADVKGSVAIRLRSDIRWAAHQWRQSAEEIELLYGDRYKQWQPLTDVERSDILRAEIGYALAEDKLGLERFRDRYAAKMAGTPDAHAFDIVSAPLGSGGDDFKDIASAAAAADTLDDFLRDMRAYYPESNPVSSGPTLQATPMPAPAPAAPQTRPAAPTAATSAPPAAAAVGPTALR